MIKLIWGYYTSRIPDAADEVIDNQDRWWHRAGPRSWQLDAGARMHEGWLLDNHGPVHCPTGERLLERRDEKLAERLVLDDGTHWCAWLPSMGAGDEPVDYDDAMMLMRAGWLAWSPKQRREALASLRETEQRELALTS